MAAKPKRNGIVLSAEQRRRQRARSIALALVLAGFALLFYAVTIVKLGPQILNRPI
jgi:hypothetical protein